MRERERERVHFVSVCVRESVCVCETEEVLVNHSNNATADDNKVICEGIGPQQHHIGVLQCKAAAAHQSERSVNVRTCVCVCVCVCVLECVSWLCVF